jgi:hypothetical protein
VRFARHSGHHVLGVGVPECDGLGSADFVRRQLVLGPVATAVVGALGAAIAGSQNEAAGDTPGPDRIAAITVVVGSWPGPAISRCASKVAASLPIAANLSIAHGACRCRIHPETGRRKNYL